MSEPRMEESMPGLFQVIAEYTYDWESWIDAGGVVRWINPALERITGYGVDEWLGRDDYPLGLACEADRPLLARVLEDAARGESGNDVEFRVQCKNGALRWVAISWQAVRAPSGELLGYRTSVRDIEERKRSEAELDELRKRAEAAAVARTELLANVSHELRSPLHCIAGFTDLLSDTPLDAEQRRYLDRIERECSMMLRHVEDLLQLAAIEAGGIELERRPLELEELVRSVVEAERPGAESRGVALRAELDCEQLWVEGDARRLGQVLRNLVDNALKFTQQGEVSVRVRSRRQHGRVQVELEVRDSGCGMEPRELERLLQPFQQGASASTRRHGGVGLGLSIVKRLVSAMQGALQIDSSPGLGTSVHVSVVLPAAEPSPRAPETASWPRREGQRALVVDDSAPSRELLRALLERSGYQVAEADSGRAALERVAEQPDVELVLLDYQMPDADGIQTAVSLRQRLGALTRARPAIYLLTANVFARAQLERAEGAIDGILEKPLSKPRLAALLRSLEAAADTRPVRPARRDATLDAELIADLHQLGTERGEPLLPRLLASAELGITQELSELGQAANAADQAAVARCAHRIAGHAAIVGARQLADRARRLELRAEAGRLSPAAAHKAAEQLRGGWRRAEQALRAEIRKAPPAGE